MSLNQSSLIVRLPNWVGDVMMALPSLQALHDIGIDLHLFGKPWIFDILNDEYFHLHVYHHQNLQSTLKALRKIKSKNLLLFTNSFSSAFSGKLAGKKLIGFKKDARGMLLRHGLNKMKGLHEANYFWELSKFAVETCYPELKWPSQIPHRSNLTIKLIPQEKLTSILKSANIEGNYWVLCPLAKGKGEKGQSKIWPYWQSFYEKISDQNITALACPGPNEEKLLRQIIPNIKIIPNLSLTEYATILKQAEKVIANDSGPMHLATAVGANVLGIFGTTDPNRTHPWGGNWIGKKNQWPTLEEVIHQIRTKGLHPD